MPPLGLVVVLFWLEYRWRLTDVSGLRACLHDTINVFKPGLISAASQVRYCIQSTAPKRAISEQVMRMSLGDVRVYQENVAGRHALPGEIQCLTSYQDIPPTAPSQAWIARDEDPSGWKQLGS